MRVNEISAAFGRPSPCPLPQAGEGKKSPLKGAGTFKASCLLFPLLLTACAVGPDYHRPDVATPAAFKEAGNWKRAQPGDTAPRGDWWEVYGDPELSGLTREVAEANLNVQVAAAQYRQAIASLGAARANYWPVVGANFSATRSQPRSATSGANGGARISNSVSLSLDASWEADLWGRISRNVEAGQAAADASVGDLGNALLSAQATLVQTYFQLRATDAHLRLLDKTIAAYQRSLDITRNRYEAGVAARTDVIQAETQLQSAQAQAIDLVAQRAQYEHAIAILIGKPPADFSITALQTDLPNVPAIPDALPSELLERRPDIAAAERRMAAANAQIGVAESAFYPSLTLGASGGYQNSALANLLTMPNRFWSFGPALALTLLDGGARKAQKEGAVAAYDATVATYRLTVLGAFQEVEDNLALLRQLDQEATVQQAATASAELALELTQNQYLAGTVSYLNVVTAQTTALSAESNLINIANRRLVAHATLLKALGGDWRAE
ncbi:MAG: efflux transporter outer membrane subunit [Methylobacillus sp.]|nr:efflux transporter outer membrane subunit [Methylobacillus sp.]